MKKVYLRKHINENVGNIFANSPSEFPGQQQYSYELLNFDRRFEIKPIKNICKLLDYTISANISNYIYTHKGRVTYSILDNLDMRKYFKEILTIENRFASS